jgi:glycerophosphoryl diester phosphodiesterase
VTEVLDRVRARERSVLVGISVGGQIARLSRRWLSWRDQVLDGLAACRWDALMAQHRLIDVRLMEDVVSRQGRVYAWTVNEREAIRSLLGLGVHGITTADPRLFVG